MMDQTVSTAIAQQIKDGEKARQEHNAREETVVRLDLMMILDKDGKPTPIFMTFREASMLHFELGKLLTRLSTPATPQDGKGQEPT